MNASSARAPEPDGAPPTLDRKPPRAGQFKADTISKKEVAEENVDQEIDVILATLSTYYFEGKPFLLMDDIQNVFDLREDQCLGCFAQFADVDFGFVDLEDNCPLNVLDTDAINFTSKEKVGALILPLCAEYEEGLPTEEEFNALQERLDLQKIGREQNINIEEVQSRVQGSIDIYQGNLLDYDETPMV